MKPKTPYSPVPSIPTVWAGKSGKKRGRRILPGRGGYFAHVTSRAIQQQFLFGDMEKAEFIDLMRRWADFSGISVLTHCVMSNHFHLFLWIPEPQQVRTEEIHRRIQRVWPAKKVEGWMRYFQAGDAKRQREMKKALTDRMHDLPAFMRVLKQSFSVWYNERHEVSGTLWEGRYRCMVVSDSAEALMNVAAYIDLNPMRAGLCRDPKEYPWSGYGQAIAGDGEFREGLRRLVQRAKGILPSELKNVSHGMASQGNGPRAAADRTPVGWQEAEVIYRAWLYSKGRSVKDDPSAPERRRKRRGFSSMEVLEEFKRVLE